MYIQSTEQGDKTHSHLLETLECQNGNSFLPSQQVIPHAPQRSVLSACGLPYLGVHTRLSSLILFVGSTLVQFVPQGFGLPGGHFGLELGVEVSVVQSV